jgi:nucleoside-diphosphate-sugar epimerase
MKRILVAGCGDIGCRLGLLLSAAGHQVTGLRRNTSGMPTGITPLAADLILTESLAGLTGPFDQVVFLPTPDERHEVAYEQVFRKGLANLRAALPAFEGRLIAVSSTAVYGEHGGCWVDETTQPNPAGFNGRVLLGMEQDAADLFPGCVIVRFSGIYGPGRDRLIRTVKDGSAFSSYRAPVWTNRIHSTDAAGVLYHLLGLEQPDRLYLASDEAPVPSHEILNWLAAGLGVPHSETNLDETQVHGKRVNASRLRHSGYRMHYPDYVSGYRDMLAEVQDD